MRSLDNVTNSMDEFEQTWGDRDAEIEVLARYTGRVINTNQPEPVEEMAGKAAFLGGRVGKGKVFVSCPHPEKEEPTFDLVMNGIKYLTGVAPTPVYLERARGAVVVRYCSSDKASAEFLFGTLYRDGRFYVWSGKELEDLLHVDAVVITGKAGKSDVGRLEKFMRRGGRVVIVADTSGKRKAAKRLKGAVVVDSYDKVVDALLRQ